jgi:hypothetical protein
MPAEKVFLSAIMTNREGKRVWAGEYACSKCGQQSRPDPTDSGKLSLDFSIHKYKHPIATGN